MENEYEDVLKLNHADSAVAKEAFNRLSKPVSRFLRNYLRPMLPSEADREDAIAMALAKIWSSRASFQPKGRSAWWCYVAKIGRRLAIDLSGSQSLGELPDDLPESDHLAIEEVAATRDQQGRLYRAADELWLGLEREISSSVRARRLLAAQLFYVHRRSWQEICAQLGSDREPVTREQFDQWLSHEPVLRELAMTQLYWDNDTLAGWLLRPEAPLTSAELDHLAKERADMKASRAILLYFRYGIYAHRVKQVLKDVPEKEIDEILAEAKARLPIASCAENLFAIFRALPRYLAALQDAGLWKRLIFAYNVECQLPHDHTFERISPAASVFSHHVTVDTITMATSGGRLFKELANHMKEEAQVAGSI